MTPMNAAAGAINRYGVNPALNLRDRRRARADPGLLLIAFPI
jgi:hypothetical protein